MQFRLIVQLISGVGKNYLAAGLLVPFLAKLYARELRVDTWKTWFRLVSSFFYILAAGVSVYAVSAGKRTIERVVIDIKAAVLQCLSLSFLLYTVLFGLSEASVGVSQDSTLSSATLENSTVSCGISDPISQWAACLYIAGLGLSLWATACAAASLLLPYEKTTWAEESHASGVNIPKSFREIDTCRGVEDLPGAPPVIELFKRTRKSRGAAKGSDNEKSFEVVGVPPAFPASSSATRHSRGVTKQKK